MLILALDTTTKGGSVAVVRDDTALAVMAGDASRTHGERLPGEIDAALAAAGVKPIDLDLLVVASGPGAFTGLRIGLAAMQGIAMTLGTPVIGVSALDAIAQSAFSPDRVSGAGAIARVGAWMDAQRGEVYAALYEAVPESVDMPWRMLEPPTVGAPAEIAGAWQATYPGAVRSVGDGAIRFRDTIEASAPGWIVDPDVPLLAPALAWIGRRRAARGEAGPPHALQPVYVRRPDAEIERERRLQS